jgi:endonuclease-8
VEIPVPEGHLLHRYADQISSDLAGRAVAATSPQGRFDPSPVDGRVLLAVEAHGKHLLHLFADAPVVHVHLGMRGLYLRYESASTPARSGVRLRLAADAAWDLLAPTTCELLDAERRRGWSAGWDRTRCARTPTTARRSTGWCPQRTGGVAVLDQAVWAGVGNAWRAELLHVQRLDPAMPCSRLSTEQAAGLWDTTRRLLRLGRDAGQVVSDPAAPDERWVYKRETCRSCGAPVVTSQLGGRTSYLCPVEQA